MKNRELIVVVLTIALLVILGACILFNQNFKGEPGKNIVETILNLEPETKVYAHLSDATVTYDSEDNRIINKDGVVFNIVFADDVPDDYVEKTFKIECRNSNESDEIKTEVIKEDSKSYKLKIADTLSEGAIYNVVELTSDGVKKWAFQTEKEFKVDYTYPANKEFFKINSDPEIRFTDEIQDNIKDYLSIEPSVNGYWEKKYSSYYYFRHPNDYFKDGQEYTIKVKKGAKDKYGNELKDDYSFSFIARSNTKENKITDVELISENVFNINENVSFISYIFMNDESNKGIKVDDSKIRIYKLDGTKTYIDLLRKINKTNNIAKELYDNNDYKLVLEKNALDVEYVIQREKYISNNFYQVDTDFKSSKAGYYFALLKINDCYSIKPFQINDEITSVNFLTTGEALAFYKNPNNSNNVVDIFVNNTSVGKTDNDGKIYFKDLKKQVVDFNEEFNYIEFKCETPLVFDITSQLIARNGSWENIYYSESYEDYYINSDDTKTLVYTRHNNGYIYSDRPVYKVGETVKYWGYARNRVYDVDSAIIKIYCEEDLLKKDNLTLNEQGCFTYDFELKDVNSGAYVYAELYINGVYVDRISSNILDYTTSAYSVNVEQEANVFVTGETTNVKITANTYDGIPLTDTKFNVGNISNDKYVDVVAENITTDANGVGYGKVTFNAINNQPNTYSNYVHVRYDNSYIDGGSYTINYTVYPYINRAYMNEKYNKETNSYEITFEEYNVKNRNTPGNDTITLEAKARYEQRYEKRRYYDEYSKSEEIEYGYNQISMPEYDKTFEVNIVNGKGKVTIPNWSDGKNEKGYYALFAYINTSDGRRLSCSSYENTVYLVYGYDMYDEDEEKVVLNDEDLGEFISQNTKSVITKSNNKPMYHSYIDYNKNMEYGKKVTIPLVKGVGSEYIEGGSSYYIEEPVELSDEEYQGIEVYTFIVSGQGTELIKNVNGPISFTYKEKYGANIRIYPVIYDGEKIYAANYLDVAYGWDGVDYQLEHRFSNSLILESKQLLLDIDVTFDKETYKPGEEAIIKVKTSHDGKGVSSGVNLSAIDSAYIDENGSNSSYIQGSLYNPYSFSASEISSHMFLEVLIRDAGGAGGGDGEGYRTDILTTAFFENIITDKNGEATIKVKLPDNITEWTLTTQGISEDYRAASKVSKIIVTKDFYVDLTHKDKYLEDESFAFNIKAFGSKYAGQKSKLEVSILDSNNNVLESGDAEVTVGKVGTYKIKNPLKEGKYKIKLSGSLNDSKEAKDTLIKEFEVKKSLLEILSRETLELKPNDEITVVSPRGRIYVLNEDVEKNLNMLFELMFVRGYSYRNDSVIIGNAAYKLYTLLRNGTNNNSKQYYNLEKIAQVMDGASYDYDLALRNIATGIMNYRYEVNIFDTIESNKGLFARYWAEAACDRPVLRLLDKAYEDVSKIEGAYTKEEVAHLALAFAELGDFDSAESLYDILKTAITEENEREYVLLTTLAIKINLKDRVDLYNNLMSKDLPPEVKNYIKLYYLQNEIVRNVNEGKLVLNVDGKDEDIKINNIGYTDYKVTNKSKYIVKNLTNNIKIMLDDYKPVDTSKYESKGYLDKTYNNKNVKEGNIVTVTLKVDISKLREQYGNYGIYTIQDVVPNNMVFVDTINCDHCWFSGKDGQKVEFTVYSSDTDKYATVSYHARVQNNGEQKESGTVLTNFNNEIIDIIKY